MGDIDLSCMGRRGQRIHPDDELAQSVLLASVRACSCRVSADSLLDQSPIEGLAGSWIVILRTGGRNILFTCQLALFASLPRCCSGHAWCEEYPNLSVPGNLRWPRGFSGKQRPVDRFSAEAYTRGADMKRIESHVARKIN